MANYLLQDVNLKEQVFNIRNKGRTSARWLAQRPGFQTVQAASTKAFSSSDSITSSRETHSPKAEKRAPMSKLRARQLMQPVARILSAWSPRSNETELKKQALINFIKIVLVIELE